MDTSLEARRCVPHATANLTGPETPTALARASCARCGAPLPRTRSGRVKGGIRFCREACRLADVRDRRAKARGELVDALAAIRLQLEKAEAALATLGLMAADQRHGGSRGR